MYHPNYPHLHFLKIIRIQGEPRRMEDWGGGESGGPRNIATYNVEPQL